MEFMGGQKEEKKSSMITEQIFDVICLITSYGILFLLPQKIDVFFYLIFGISAFLFCIGFFRLGFTFHAPAGANGILIAGLFYVIIGALINAAALYEICRDQGSGRSITIATLLLIEALVLFAMAAGRSSTPESQRRAAVLLRAAAVFAVLFGIAFALWKHFSEAAVIMGTILLIEAVCLWKMGGGSNPFNTLTPEIQSVPGMRIPIGELKSVFADVETQLGYPWIGKIQTMKQDSIIYGPSEDGFCVYGYYLFGQFYIYRKNIPRRSVRVNVKLVVRLKRSHLQYLRYSGKHFIVVCRKPYCIKETHYLIPGGYQGIFYRPVYVSANPERCIVSSAEHSEVRRRKKVFQFMGSDLIQSPKTLHPRRRTERHGKSGMCPWLKVNSSSLWGIPGRIKLESETYIGMICPHPAITV